MFEEERPSLCRCRRRALSTTGFANGPFISTAISKSTARTIQHRRATLAAGWSCTWGGCGCASWIRRRTQCLREHPIALQKGQRRTHDADRPNKRRSSRETRRAHRRRRTRLQGLCAATDRHSRRDCPARPLRHARSAAPLRSGGRRPSVRVCGELGHLQPALCSNVSLNIMPRRSSSRPSTTSSRRSQTYATHFTTLTQGATP